MSAAAKLDWLNLQVKMQPKITRKYA